MNIQVTISDDRWGYSFSYVAEIDSVLAESFEPLSRSDDPMIAGIMGDATMEQAEVVLKFRKDTAELIAVEISKALLTEMKKQDTINGYKVVKDE